MQIHFSTGLLTKDKLEYNFFPVTSGELKFKVRAPHDAHVALTTGPTEGKTMYEVSYKIFLKTLKTTLIYSRLLHYFLYNYWYS